MVSTGKSRALLSTQPGVCDSCIAFGLARKGADRRARSEACPRSSRDPIHDDRLVDDARAGALAMRVQASSASQPRPIVGWPHDDGMCF
jgi:hypothetical protein